MSTGPLCRRETSCSQGVKWNALISTYIGTFHSAATPHAAEQSKSSGPPPKTPVSSAMMAKVGVAARDIQ